MTLTQLKQFANLLAVYPMDTTFEASKAIELLRKEVRERLEIKERIYKTTEKSKQNDRRQQAVFFARHGHSRDKHQFCNPMNCKIAKRKFNKLHS